MITFIGFEKKLFPVFISRRLSWFYFYPMLPITIIRNNYLGLYVAIDDGVFLGGCPIALIGHLDNMERDGICAVLNLMDENRGPMSEYKRRGWSYLRIPVVDHVEPDVEEITEAIDFIRTQRQDGRNVLIHCKGGHGRSAAIAFCWLVTQRRMSPGKAQRHLNNKRSVRKNLYAQPSVRAYLNLNAASEESLPLS